MPRDDRLDIDCDPTPWDVTEEDIALWQSLGWDELVAAGLVEDIDRGAPVEPTHADPEPLDEEFPW